MIHVYNILIKIYGVSVFLFSFFNKKASLFIKGRKQWENRLKKLIAKNNKYIWVHCASLGEFEQGRPIIEKIKKKYPSFKIILTFFSPSGYEVRKNYDYADIVFYLPLDTKKNSKSFINIINPSIAIFVKYEFWINYINELYKKNTPLFIISSIFRENHFFFKWYGKWTLKYLKKIKLIFVQNTESKNILEKNNINSVICGDTRFDRVIEIKNENKRLNVIEKFKDDKFLIVFGSTWQKDEKLIIDFINQNKNPNLKYIIAPHNVNELSINKLIQKINFNSIRYTKADTERIGTNILILDTIGVLMYIYKYSNLTYIGGGFEKGIHNILEPAVFGNPIIIGPKFNKFHEAIELSKIGGISIINNKHNFQIQLNNIINNKDLLQRKSNICNKFIVENSNSTNKVLDKISIFIHNEKQI